MRRAAAFTLATSGAPSAPANPAVRRERINRGSAFGGGRREARRRPSNRNAASSASRRATDGLALLSGPSSPSAGRALVSRRGAVFRPVILGAVGGLGAGPLAGGGDLPIEGGDAHQGVQQVVLGILDPAGQIHLRLPAEQRPVPQLAQVGPDDVGTVVGRRQLGAAIR